MIISFGCGVAAFYGIQQYTIFQFTTTFNSVTIEIFNSLDIVLHNNYYATQTLAEIFGVTCPTAANWPNCRYLSILHDYKFDRFCTISMPANYFLNIAAPLTSIGNLRDMGTSPIVYPPEVFGFESFAYEYYAQNPFYPPNAGISTFGKGIFAKYPNGTKYHDTTGQTKYSSRNILVPALQVSSTGSFSVLMYNLHSERLRGTALEAVMDAWDNGKRNFSAVTPMMQLNADPYYRPSYFLVYPIAPADEPDVLVGFSRAVQNWDTAFSNAIPSDQDFGIDIVLFDSTGASATYNVERNRVVVFKGRGDLHDREYDSFAKYFSLFSQYEYGPSVYTIRLYPTESRFPSVFTLATILSGVSSMVFFFLLGSLYLVFNRNNDLMRQLVFKQESLDSKRAFVRFISHELRTPLNTVCMGLKVLKDEAEDAVKPPTADIGNNVKGPLISCASQLVPVQEKSPLEEKVMNWVTLIKEIEDSSNSAVHVLNELISYDKIEMKTMELDIALLPVWNLVSSSIQPFSIQARERGLQFVYFSQFDPKERKRSRWDLNQLEMADLLVPGDPVRLSQVFRNVVGNALKFTYPNTTVTIRAEWHPDVFISPDTSNHRGEANFHEEALLPSGSICVTVQDSGPGLSADCIKRVFKDNVELNPNRLQAGGGSGLGLWIAKGDHCYVTSTNLAHFPAFLKVFCHSIMEESAPPLMGLGRELCSLSSCQYLSVRSPLLSALLRKLCIPLNP